MYGDEGSYTIVNYRPGPSAVCTFPTCKPWAWANLAEIEGSVPAVAQMLGAAGYHAGKIHRAGYHDRDNWEMMGIIQGNLFRLIRTAFPERFDSEFDHTALGVRYWANVVASNRIHQGVGRSASGHRLSHCLYVGRQSLSGLPPMKRLSPWRNCIVTAGSPGNAAGRETQCRRVIARPFISDRPERLSVLPKPA